MSIHQNVPIPPETNRKSALRKYYGFLGGNRLFVAPRFRHQKFFTQPETTPPDHGVTPPINGNSRSAAAASGFHHRQT
jgi:hypothetical protein